MTPIVYTVTRRKERKPSLRDLLFALQAQCYCARCFTPGGLHLVWPSYYVGSVGRSYECYLERNDFYSGRHYPRSASYGTTTSPTAAAIGELERRGLRLARVKEKRNKRDEADAARARAQAEREGWVEVEACRWERRDQCVEVEPGKWEKRGGDLSGGADKNPGASNPNC